MGWRDEGGTPGDLPLVCVCPSPRLVLVIWFLLNSPSFSLWFLMFLSIKGSFQDADRTKLCSGSLPDLK